MHWVVIEKLANFYSVLLLSLAKAVHDLNDLKYMVWSDETLELTKQPLQAVDETHDHLSDGARADYLLKRVPIIQDVEEVLKVSGLAMSEVQVDWLLVQK